MNRPLSSRATGLAAPGTAADTQPAGEPAGEAAPGENRPLCSRATGLAAPGTAADTQPAGEPAPGALSAGTRADAPCAGALPSTDARHTGARPGTRSHAIDRLRGLALVAMLVHHLCDWLTGDARAVLPGWRSFSLTDAAAVAFFVAAGASMGLFVDSRRRRGMSRARVGGQVLRRYGMLVPIGLALDWVLWRDPLMFGVLEVLGVTVVAGAAVASLVPRRALPGLAAVVLAAGVLSERAVEGNPTWLADEAIGGKFPVVTYLGFVLLGVAAVRTGWYASRRRVFAAAAVAAVATLAMLADGIVPARYPGDVPFVVPGLAVTAVAYGLTQQRWPRLLGGVDQVLRRAAAHTLGIFLAHYLIYGVLRQQHLMGTVAGAVAVPVALAGAAALCLMAPRVPQLPWSLRTGRRRRAVTHHRGAPAHWPPGAV